MTEIIRHFETYLRETLHATTKASPWSGEKGLPFFLRELYAFYEIVLYEKSCVLVVAKERETAPAALKKHFQQVQAKFDGLCIYVSKSISSYNRQRMIQHRIPFVIPGNQMYLPDLGIDFREQFRQFSQEPQTISFPTQAIILYALTHRETTQFTPSQLAKVLHYTSMTMTRAFHELESKKIGNVFRKGRERWIHFEESSLLWRSVQPLLRNPIKKTVWIRKNDKTTQLLKKSGAFAGLTALSMHSLLNPPHCPVYAISAETWRAFKQYTEEIPASHEADIELEIWSYDPLLFAKKGVADPFSISLSLHENKDERVQTALEKFMEQIQW